MTAQQVLDVVATMPREEWATIQRGIAEMMVTEMSPEEIAEIRTALAEADAEFNRGEGISLEKRPF